MPTEDLRAVLTLTLHELSVLRLALNEYKESLEQDSTVENPTLFWALEIRDCNDMLKRMGDI